MKWVAKSAGEISLTGTAQEIEAVEAMLNGTVLLGNPPAAPLRTPLFHPPNLALDPDEARFFPPKLPEFEADVGLRFGPVPVAANQFSQERFDAFIKGIPEYQQSCISVYVHGLGGYGGSKDELTRRGLLMWEIGFSQMRSPRGPDGKYWEVWYLPGAWSAAGPLKGSLSSVIEYLIKNVRPGSIDLVRQYLGLGVD